MQVPPHPPDRVASRSGFRKLPDDFDAARPDLRPRLWSRLSFEKARLQKRLEGNGLDADALPMQPIGDHLALTLAFDWSESVQSINQDNLDSWGVSFFEALEAGEVNLQEATQGYAQVREGFYAFASGDSYDATRIILADRIETLEVAGRPVAMAPNRDGSLITGSEGEEGLAMLAGMAAQGQGEPLRRRACR